MKKQRSDGRFQTKIYLGDGKYKYITARSRKELEEKTIQARIALNKGIDLTSYGDTFGEWAQQWLYMKYDDVSYRRYTAYRGNLSHLESLAHIPITKLRPIDFQSVFYELKKEGFALSTIKACRCAAKQVFDLAISNRVTDYNPVQFARLPKDTPKEDTRRALTDQEIQWILDTPHRAQTAAMIMLYAGLRRGELIPLTWDCIDLDSKTIQVRQSVSADEEGMHVKSGGKTASATRIVDIPDILVEHLRTVERTSELVCPSARGRMMGETAWKRLWESYLADLNLKYGDFPEGRPSSKFSPKKIPFTIPNITAHWLRHTYITMLYQAGVDVLTAKEQAGHADIHTTLEIYTHLDKIYKRHQMDKLNDFIAKKQGDTETNPGPEDTPSTE